MIELLNKTIETVYISDDEETLLFITPAGEIFKYVAYGDCCSHSWFYSSNNIKAILGNEITKVQENIEREEEKNEDGYTKFYSIDLITSHGTCTIEYRNNSNGYYGGSCEYREFYENTPQNDVNKLEKFLNKWNLNLSNFRELKEDF